MQNQLHDLIILAGGKGTRIAEYQFNNPKPLIKIGKSSVLEKVLYQFCKYQFRKIFIITGFRASKIINKFHKKYINFNEIICLKEKKPMGTAGFINSNLKKFTNSFYIVNADSFCDFDFHDFNKIKLNKKKGKIILVKNTTYRENNKLSNLSLNNQKIVVNSKDRKLMNAGIYFLTKKCFAKTKGKEILSLETEIILPLIDKKQILGYKSDNVFIDIGTPKNFKKSNIFFKKNFYKPAIFLDRDGTINEDIGYLHEFKKFKLKKHIIKLLKYFTKKKFYIFIITNQAGIAKKKFSLEQFFKFQIKFKNFFSKHKIYFDEVMYCPYHKNAKLKKYKKNSLFRKPGNLMVESILKRWNVNVKKSFFIGDTKKDLLCATKSNIKFFYYSEDLHKVIKYYT